MKPAWSILNCLGTELIKHVQGQVKFLKKA